MSKKFTRTQILILAGLALMNCLVISLMGGAVVFQTLNAAKRPAATVATAPTALAPTATSLPRHETPPTWTPIPTPQRRQRPAGFIYDPCPFAVPEGADVECGFIDAPERYDGSSDATIRLAVAVYYSVSDTPAPDPVIYLSGGPGGSAVEPISTVYADFIRPILEERDFIVFDQRGTGNSKPALACPDYIAVPLNRMEREFRANAAAAQQYVNKLVDCSDWLKRRDIDVSAYTSAASAADVHTVLTTLGYSQVNLYGGSYGTRLAQTVMRDYPQIVRSAVLDSVVPIETNIYREHAAKAYEALSVLFAGCASDPDCSAAYPNLDQTYYNLVKSMDADPIVVKGKDPKTGFYFYVMIDGVELTGIIFSSLQLTEYIPRLPQLIDDIARRDYALLSAILSEAINGEDSINVGMFLSVNCSEEVFATTPEELTGDYALYPETEAFAKASLFDDIELYFTLCRQWGAADLDPREVEPLQSAIPTLILAGEYDSATPPFFGRQLAGHLEQTYYIELPGQGHCASIYPGGCPSEIARAFLHDPTRSPDVACMAEMTGPDFIVE